MVAAAVARARIADLAQRAVLEAHDVLVLVEALGQLDVAPMRPHPALGMGRARQLGTVVEIPVRLPEVMLKVAGHANGRDPRVAVARARGMGLELLGRARAVRNEELELDAAVRRVVADLPGPETLRHVHSSHRRTSVSDAMSPWST